MSMYVKAQQIGLPVLFVDIRHEGAHGEMPPLEILRGATRQALQWLWDHYWKDHENAVQDHGIGLQHSDYRRQGASQQGQWTQWTGPWSEKPIGREP